MTDVEFGDADQYRSGGQSTNPLTFPFLLLEQVRRCAKAGSVEFRGGYNNRIYQGNAPPVEVYIPATHETFSEAVETLRDMLEGYLPPETAEGIAELHRRLKEAWGLVVDRSREEGKKIPEGRYEFERVKVARKVFRILMDYLRKINYFEQGATLEIEDDDGE